MLLLAPSVVTALQQSNSGGGGGGGGGGGSGTDRASVSPLTRSGQPDVAIFHYRNRGASTSQTKSETQPCG
jgi:hypothetical protein